MEFIKNTLDFSMTKPGVITFGKFDGLHKGHEILISSVLSYKKEKGYQAIGFTFDFMQEERKVLTTTEEKEYIFAQTGLDCLIECPFTEEVRQMSAEDFVAWIVKTLSIKCIVVGTDFRFGYKRSGDYHTLQNLSTQYGYEVLVLEKLKHEGRDISSTYIREEIAEGRIKEANGLLGYPYFVRGTIVHGQKLGRRIGIPTINMILPQEKLLPPNGVYRTEVLVDGKSYSGITNVGTKPTVSSEGKIGVETYILDFSEMIYGEEVMISFLDFLRPEKRFDSVEELKAQMEKDIAIVRLDVDKCYKNITKIH